MNIHDSSTRGIERSQIDFFWRSATPKHRTSINSCTSGISSFAMCWNLGIYEILSNTPNTLECEWGKTALWPQTTVFSIILAKAKQCFDIRPVEISTMTELIPRFEANLGRAWQNDKEWENFSLQMKNLCRSRCRSQNSCVIVVLQGQNSKKYG